MHHKDDWSDGEKCLREEKKGWKCSSQQEEWTRPTMCSIQPPYYRHSLTEGSVGKPLNKQKTDWCKPLIVTVCNNKEVIYHLLSATHSWTVSEEWVKSSDQTRGECESPRSDPVVYAALFQTCLTPFSCYPLIDVWERIAQPVSCFTHSPTHFASTFSSSPLSFSVVLSAFPPALCIVPSSAAVSVQTLFHHINLTSPLKDWPHTKLLFKGKKYTCRG